MIFLSTNLTLSIDFLSGLIFLTLPKILLQLPFSLSDTSSLVKDIFPNLFLNL